MRSAIARHVEEQIRQDEKRMFEDSDTRRDFHGKRKPLRPPIGKRGGVWMMGWTRLGTSYWYWEPTICRPPFYIGPLDSTWPSEVSR